MNNLTKHIKIYVVSIMLILCQGLAFSLPKSSIRISFPLADHLNDQNTSWHGHIIVMVKLPDITPAVHIYNTVIERVLYGPYNKVGDHISIDIPYIYQHLTTENILYFFIPHLMIIY